MESKPKIIKASLISSLLVLLPLTLFAIAVIAGEIFRIPGLVSTDDAPVRAAGLLLIILMPALYPLLAVTLIVVGYILKYFNKLSRRNLYSACGVLSILTSVGFCWPSPFGIRDQIIGLFVFFPIALLSLLFGAYFWWKIAITEEDIHENKA